MFWELLATVFAGLGAAGIALFLRLATAKRVPAWTIPVFAGTGMLAFQVYSEYTWFSHQKSLLPETVQVVKAVEQTSPWRPWTLVFPQTVRFIAIEVGEGAANQLNPDLVLANVYLFERRYAARRLHQVFHCQENARADFSSELQVPMPGEVLSPQWRTLESDDPLLVAACTAVPTAGEKN